MVLDIIGTILQTAVSLGDISHQQMFHDTLSIPRMGVSGQGTYLSKSRGNFILPLRIFW